MAEKYVLRRTYASVTPKSFNPHHIGSREPSVYVKFDQTQFPPDPFLGERIDLDKTTNEKKETVFTKLKELLVRQF